MLRARSVAGRYWPCAFSVRAIAIAPWWCAIIMVRNSRSNADPVKPWSIPISASIIIKYGEVVPPMPGDGMTPSTDVEPIGPGVMTGTGLPPIPDVDPIGRAVMLGTAVGWPQLVSHPVMVVISGPWAARTRSAIVLTCPLAARVPARVAISMACGWCEIINSAKLTSAALCAVVGDPDVAAGAGGDVG